ncbi:MAG TPA: hypothetical protein VJX67_10925, partial [Blastocatellia bacterium]|nr:hypothetical protein [Blastocatellia bacterium]
RSRIDVLGTADWFLNKTYKDEQLRSWFAMMNAWELKLGLEVGAVKEWGTTGSKTFQVETPYWDRFQSLGAKIDAVAMDEPLSRVRRALKKPDAYAVEETAQFVALVRQKYPDIRIGDIEPYPSIPLADHIAWIKALQSRLSQMKVRGLDFYRLDVDWVNPRSHWQEVKRLELACRSQHLPFSLIYWASDFPQLKGKGLANKSTWYTSIMREARDYAAVGGSPDEYVIESWLALPTPLLPETGQSTFTQSVRDFCRRFVASKDKTQPARPLSYDMTASGPNDVLAEKVHKAAMP